MGKVFVAYTSIRCLQFGTVLAVLETGPVCFRGMEQGLGAMSAYEYLIAWSSVTKDKKIFWV